MCARVGRSENGDSHTFFLRAPGCVREGLDNNPHSSRAGRSLSLCVIAGGVLYVGLCAWSDRGSLCEWVEAG